MNFATILLAALMVQDPPQQDNPEYSKWRRFKAGSFATQKEESELNGRKTEIERTQTLVEITAKQAVVEYRAMTHGEGKAIEGPVNKREIPAKIAPNPGFGPNAVPQQPDKTETRNGEETLEIDGKKLKCKWIELTLHFGDVKQRIKTWTSEEVPGLFVKEEAERSDGGKSLRVVIKWESK